MDCELSCGFRELLGLSTKISLRELTKRQQRRRESPRLSAIASSLMGTVLHARRMRCELSQLPSPAAAEAGEHRLLSTPLSEIPRVVLGHESCFGFGKSRRTKTSGGSGLAPRGGGQRGLFRRLLGPSVCLLHLRVATGAGKLWAGLSHRLTFPETIHPFHCLRPSRAVDPSF